MVNFECLSVQKSNKISGLSIIILNPSIVVVFRLSAICIRKLLSCAIELDISEIFSFVPTNQISFVFSSLSFFVIFLIVLFMLLLEISVSIKTLKMQFSKSDI